MKRLLVLTVILFVACGVAARAQKPKKLKYAPLPAPMLAAKKVFLVNLSDFPDIGDAAYKSLTKWARYSLVERREDADLIFVLSAEITGRETREIQFGQDTITTHPAGTYVPGAPPSFGGTTSTINRAPRIPITNATGYTTLRVFDTHTTDPASAGPLWVSTKPWGGRGATTEIFEDLKKRVQYQEKAE